MTKYERQRNSATTSNSVPDTRLRYFLHSGRYGCPDSNIQKGDSEFFLKPNLILDEQLTVQFGDPNRLENAELIYCWVNVRNEPPKGFSKWFKRRGCAPARDSEIWLTTRMSGVSKSDQLVWPSDDNPKAYVIPNNGRPYRVILLFINAQSREIWIPTGPALGQGKYRYSTLSAGLYDLALEVGPPTELTKREWLNLTLPDDILKIATK